MKGLRASIHLRSFFRSEKVHTAATVVTGEAILLKDYLIAVCLQYWEVVGRLAKEKTCLGRIASKRCVVVKELTIPDFTLRLPVHNKAAIHRPSKLQIRKVRTVLKLVGNVSLLRSVAGDAIGDDAGVIDGIARYEAGLDGRSAIVDDEGSCRRRRRRWFGLAAAGHWVDVRRVRRAKRVHCI